MMQMSLVQYPEFLEKISCSVPGCILLFIGKSLRIIVSLFSYNQNKDDALQKT